MSLPTLPRVPARIVRALQVAVAVLSVAAVLVLAAVDHAQPDPARLPPGPLVLVPDTTLRPPGYTPTPAGPPCPGAEPQEAGR